MKSTVVKLAVLLLGLLPSAALAGCPHQELSGPRTWNHHIAPAFRHWLNGDPSPPDRWVWRRTALLGYGIRLPVRYAFTHMGNGTIEIANLNLRVWRVHPGDGFIFAPDWLSARLVPDAKGCKLIVSGQVQPLDDNDTPVGLPHPIRLTYAFETASRLFRRTTATPADAIEQVDLSSE